MINRAKCNLCGDTIQSDCDGHVVYCKCQTIAVMDGPAMRTYAKDNNYAEYFLRVDDLGNEIIVKYVEKDADKEENKQSNDPQGPLTKKELIEEFEALIKAFEQIPEHGQLQPVNHRDLNNFMLIIAGILKIED